MINQDIARVAEIMGRLAPRMQRYVERVIEQDGISVGMSVAANTATHLMVFVLLTAEMHGGDADDFLRLMTDEIERNISSAKRHLTPDGAVH